MNEGNYRGKKWTKKIIAVITFIGIGGLFTVAQYIYVRYLQQPFITMIPQGNSNVFQVNSEFRSISLKLHPQIVVQFDNTYIMQIYLEDYYEDEFLYFEDNKCTAVIPWKEYADKLREYISEEVLKEVSSQIGLKEGSLNKRLQIFESNIAGVMFESAGGNHEKNFCILEKNGIVQNISRDDIEVQNRLRETKLTMRADLQRIEKDEEVKEIIRILSEEITKILSE